jgi:hypothetical protein
VRGERHPPHLSGRGRDGASPSVRWPSWPRRPRSPGLSPGSDAWPGDARRPLHVADAAHGLATPGRVPRTLAGRARRGLRHRPQRRVRDRRQAAARRRVRDRADLRRAAERRARVVAGRRLRRLSLDAARRDLDRARAGRSAAAGLRVWFRPRLVAGRAPARLQSDPLADIAPNAYGANVPSTIWTVARDGGDRRGSRLRPTPWADTPRPPGHRTAGTSRSRPTPRRRAASGPSRGGRPRPPARRGPRCDLRPRLRSRTGAGSITRRADRSSSAFPWRRAAAPAPRGDRHSRPGRGAPSRDERRRPPPGPDEPEPVSQPLDGGRIRTQRGSGGTAPSAHDDTSRRKTTPAWSPDGKWIAYTGSRGGPGATSS